MQDLVSVIIPVYNGEKTIRRAIESVQKQSYSNIQIIVVDDCSRDNTYEIIKNMSNDDERIVLFKNEKNLGAAESRNYGCSKATGKYIGFLDSDDLWYPEKIEIQLEHLEKTGADFCYTSYEMIEKEGRESCKKCIISDYVDYKTILKENIICCSSVLIYKELIEKNPFINNYFHEDFILWLQLLKQGYKAVGVTQCLVVYQKGGRSADKINAMKYRWKIYRQHENLNILSAIYYFVWYGINGIKKYYIATSKHRGIITKEKNSDIGF